MFTVYLSNSLEKLKDELSHLLCDNPPVSPLTPEIIMVQSQGMQKWLSLRLSEKFGSWVSFKYLFPNKFLDAIFTAALGLPPATSRDPFNRDQLSWLLMKELGRIRANSTPEFSDISKYLENDPDGLKIWQLATRIAYTFDQYLTFRFDYITAWENENSHSDIDRSPDDSDFSKNWRWQEKLWGIIKKNIDAKHRIEHFHDLISAIKKKEPTKQNALPARAIVFGIPILPPLHVDVLSAISSACPIHMFLLYPTKLPDDIDIRQMTSKSKEYSKNQNTLLESLGSLGYGFLQELYKKNDIIFKKFFIENDEKNRSLLCTLQHNILHNKTTGCDHHANGDSSISIVSCHSPMREIEVLRDYLLEILNTPAGPRIDEILVMTPEIERYTPYIDAVFSSSDPAIPYTISDRSLKVEHIGIAAFLAILDFASSRFEVSSVLDLLEKKPLQKRLKIVDEDLSVIRKWIEDTRIRWGFNAREKECFDIPPTAENTWKAGIERMLLGFAMPDAAFFDGIVPYDEIEGSLADLLGKISRFIHDLHDFTKIVSKPHTLTDWHKILSEWTSQFFEMNDESNSQYHFIENALSNLSSISTSTGFTQPVHFRVVRAYLDSILAENTSAHNFLSGKLTFCAMLPMRSIPFKVICLIGMNDGIFPRQDSNIAFDLMIKKPRPGDRSLRDEDRYLFLESIISAKEKIYISYTGQSIVDSNEIPPSVVVSELVDYFNKHIRLSDANSIVIKHPLQPFSKRYFTGDSVFSYSKQNLETARMLVQPIREQLPPFIDGKISEPVFKDISLDELHSFLENPARYFLQRGLGLRFRREMNVIEDDEPFFIDSRSGYQIKSLLLEDLLKTRATGDFKDRAFQKYRALGFLPHGNVGAASFEKLHNEISDIVQKALKYRFEKSLSPVLLKLEIESTATLLKGILHDVYEKFQTILRPGNINAKVILKGWIYHLALCAQENDHLPKKTVLIGSSSTYPTIKDVFMFRPLEHSAAKRHLSDLAVLALTHEVELFHFIPECSLAYHMKYMGKKDKLAAVESAKKKWSSNYEGIYTEKNDPYQNLCFGKLPDELLFGKRFQENAINIFTPIFDSMETNAQ